MEGTLQGVLDDGATHAEMCTQVRAVGIDDPRRAVCSAVGDEILAERPERPHLARGELCRFGDAEPAVGKRERNA